MEDLQLLKLPPAHEEAKGESMRCQAKVFKRDTYRYCGGRQRFKMHYTQWQCARSADAGGYCWQHRAKLPASLSEKGKD